jgi:hypothetical protein
MFAIDMSGCDIVLGAEWLWTLGPILMDFKKLTMQFIQEGQQYKFQGITANSPEIISSHHMENLINKGHSDIIAQLHSIHTTDTLFVHPNLHTIISKHQFFFPLPMDFPLPVVFMIIPFPWYPTTFLPMFTLINIPLHRKMKL